MKFPSAQKGVYKLWIAALIGIVVAAFALAGSLFSGLAGDAEDIKKIGVGVAGAGGIFGIVVLVLELVGLHQASQDDSSFHVSFMLIIFSLILNFVGGIVGAFNNDVCKLIAKIIGVGSSVCTLLSLEYIFRGIISLSNQLGDENLVKEGRKLIVIIWIVFILSIVLSLLSTILGTNTADWVKIVVAILVIIAAAIDVAVEIITFLYYSKAKEMLKE